MIIRTIREQLRNITFERRRRALHERAVGHRLGILSAVGSGFVLPYVQEYVASGPKGDYAIFVVLPAVPPPAEGYPVLYLLDGNAWIAGAAEALRLQSRFAVQSEIEPIAIVAVGYPGDMPFNLGRRAYDYLPKHSSSKLSARFMQGAPWHQPGGADEFRAFLTGALRDDIAERYPVDRQRQMLCGHSFGGFFALHAFLSEPDAFCRFAALSPSLWWDERCLIRRADELIAALPRDLTHSILIAVGERETPDRPEISKRLSADAREFAARLTRQGPPGLRVDCRIIESENHQSVPTATLPAVLRFASATTATSEQSVRSRDVAET